MKEERAAAGLRGHLQPPATDECGLLDHGSASSGCFSVLLAVHRGVWGVEESSESGVVVQRDRGRYL